MASGDDKKVYMMYSSDGKQIKIGQSVNPERRRLATDVKNHGDFSVHKAKTAAHGPHAERTAQAAVMKECGLKRVEGTRDFFERDGSKANHKMTTPTKQKIWDAARRGVDRSNYAKKK